MTDSVADDDDVPDPAPLAPAAPSGKQRALLALVIILGVLILLAFAVLVGGLVMGVHGRREVALPKPWFHSLDVPAGMHLADTHVDGNRVVVHLVSPRGDEEVVLIDTATGKTVGRILVKPQVKPPR